MIARDYFDNKPPKETNYFFVPEYITQNNDYTRSETKDYAVPYHHTSNALSLPNKGYITPTLESYNHI